jgi:hypothetical protein
MFAVGMKLFINIFKLKLILNQKEIWWNYEEIYNY